MYFWLCHLLECLMYSTTTIFNWITYWNTTISNYLNYWSEFDAECNVNCVAVDFAGSSAALVFQRASILFPL